MNLSQGSLFNNAKFRTDLIGHELLEDEGK